jgi:hypothetical protein
MEQTMEKHTFTKEVVERNKHRMLTKSKFLKMAWATNFKFNSLNCLYSPRKIIIENGIDKHVYKDMDTYKTDHFLIRLDERVHFYVKKWDCDVVVLKYSKNLWRINAIRSVINILISMV